MKIINSIARYRSWRRGVAHTTLNPEGPDTVRMHLVPPRWRMLGNAPYALILNGSRILPLGDPGAILLESFILEIGGHGGEPMGGDAAERAVRAAVRRTRRAYCDVPEGELARNLGELLEALFAVARGREPPAEAGVLSLREYAPNMEAPHRMDLMVGAVTGAGGKAELDTAGWKKVIDRCRKAGIPKLAFTGGEPARRPDLAELVDYAKWFVTRLDTNGVPLTGELCGALRKAGLDSVKITVYSGDPAVHDRLAGTAGAWERTVRGLENALAAGLNTSVDTPLCADNMDYDATLAFLLGKGVRHVSCRGLMETENAAGKLPADTGPGADILSGVLASAAVFCKVHGMELSFTSPGQVEPELLRRLGLSVPVCGACLSHMAVAPDGGVVPCRSRLPDGYGLGNILNKSWRSIWNHPACRPIRGMSGDEALKCPLRKGEGERA